MQSRAKGANPNNKPHHSRVPRSNRGRLGLRCGSIPQEIDLTAAYNLWHEAVEEGADEIEVLDGETEGGANGDDVPRSVLSVGAQERRQRAEAVYAASMERTRVEMEDGLRMKDAASEVAKQERPVKMEQPRASARAAETDLMERELAELVQRQATLSRILTAKAGKTVPSPFPSPLLPLDLRPLASTSHKIKVTTRWRRRACTTMSSGKRELGRWKGIW
jgi:hypothetical protein